MGNVFGMDIRRFSVLFIAIIIILSFLASFTNLKVPQQNSSTVQIGSGGGSSEFYSYPGPKYIYNKTITLAPNIQDLAYVKGTYSDLPAPYYYLPNTSIPVLFNFSKPENNILNLLLDALSRNASIIAPGPYGALLSIASSAYVNIINYTNTTLQPFPLNKNDTENYSKWEIIIKYGKTLEAPNGFQSGWSYPPSDLISVNSPVYKIINETSVKTSVNVQYNEYTYLYNKYTHKQGNVTYVYEYYAMKVWGTAYLYANNQLINSQSFATTFYWYGGEYGPNYIYGTITVPPGVSKEVYGSYSIAVGAGYKHYQRTVNNTTYIYYIYYPTGPYSSTTGYQFNWYEYNVSIIVYIKVYNGTNPVTSINNQEYAGRDIKASAWYTVWSSLPQNYSVKILTYDTIQVGNYTITRMWNAGTTTIIPKVNMQRSGNVINYYLTFNVQSDLVQPPPWISQKMIYSKSAAISWFYLEQNASLAHALYSYIMNTINKSDLQFWKFEYFVLASQFVMYTYNTTYSVFNNLLELESFYENWSLVSANILNLSAWPKLQYFNYQIMFFNVSRIPQIYNNTIFMNITGNYEIYLVDIYNALYYGGFNKVPFGNIYYYFNPLNNETTYFYLNTTGQHIPFIHEPLYFESANYILNLFYAAFQYTASEKTEIISIWNGTVWVS
ncbi:hypothetical protein SULI_07815 [Saccharolobus solfataricus]|uniref:Uncharacterized protein n=2 Tax=Saccharolobus solfataricus TaxID=2287 RepID=A0A0E3KCG1_SACSO|nr:hypothetical protein [Saccharolobus solfataricus]AKA73824.1 hypothetical protein SULB_1563 [Saccharolobus solfataricus]AKA76521.1 hypothetical protein SULC_1561 [Saccharolobus solfataricus]AKA79214.1 hypothetical protein SULA_1562 [Saccharolobus solfataricus]AZF68304.1 hypothetical protein SULG_07815 [Saccharolobus solfataricus]AZF70924.1 hypothetical protein SULH_07815 [Saccharolobus solfataricus]